MMYWYHYLILMMFITMIVSPVWFFGKVSKMLFDEADPHEPVVQHINIKTILPNEEPVELMHADERVLQNLDKMIKASRNKHVKQLWKIKKAEFARQMSWRVTVRDANG